MKYERFETENLQTLGHMLEKILPFSAFIPNVQSEELVISVGKYCRVSPAVSRHALLMFAKKKKGTG